MRIAFCIYDFTAEKLALQPWLTVIEIATGLVRKGYDVLIVTDAVTPATLPGVKVRTVSSLRGSNSAEMKQVLYKFSPGAVVVLPTPLNIVTSRWLQELICRRVGFASYPFYESAELITAARLLGGAEVVPYLKHLLVPAFMWHRMMRRNFDVIITQSQTTRDRLQASLGGADKAVFIPPGMPLDDWPANYGRDRETGEINLLYLGAAIPVRGFAMALDALGRIQNDRVCLRVLARGADKAALQKIRSEVSRRGLLDRVSITGGWLERNELVAEIHRSDIVLQPFILVPSELPVATMEVIACGRPVLGCKIDGLPSTIGPAGSVVKQGDAWALAEQIELFAVDADTRHRWRDGCVERRNEMTGWDRVVDQWEEVLHG